MVNQADSFQRVAINDVHGDLSTYRIDVFTSENTQLAPMFIKFQIGDVQLAGINGITELDLLQLVQLRLPEDCEAFKHVSAACECLTVDRNIKIEEPDTNVEDFEPTAEADDSDDGEREEEY